MTDLDAKTWATFQTINQKRRSIRDFDGSNIPDEEVYAILNEALLAPSSGNTQPYELHWIKNPALKALVAKACNDQRAASSASALIVMVAAPHIAKSTIEAQNKFIEQADSFSESSKAYNRQGYITLKKFLRYGPLVIWSPFSWILSLVMPIFALLPFGPTGIRNWNARNSIFAAQTLLLAAVARGYDVCPMEGFDARKVARLLRLSRSAVIPVVIAIGRRRDDARIDPQWRRPFDDAVVVHGA